ncbi:MAG TPA: extracellular solute-binding protein [Candidatus Binatia bacterium]
MRLGVLPIALVFVPVVGAASGEGWRKTWEVVVAAAEKEGSVTVAHGGTASPDMGRAFREGFQKSYPNIQVNLTIAGGRSIAPRMLMERRVGRYLWDVYIGGTTTALAYLVPAGILDPIQPALILPEVLDMQNWLGGKLDFADNAETLSLVFGSLLIAPVAYNTNLVKGEEIKSHWDFLDPKWRGKLVMFDPRRPGIGLATVTFWYNNPKLGKDFIGRLFTEQDISFIQDSRQVIERVARGEQWATLGVSPAFYESLKAQGLPLDLRSADDLKEGSYVTAGVGNLGLVNRAPHPNAAKVYINWLLSKEGQTVWSRASQYPSRRLDVPYDHLNPANVAKKDKLSLYQSNYQESFVDQRTEILKFLAGVIKR